MHFECHLQFVSILDQSKLLSSGNGLSNRFHRSVVTDLYVDLFPLSECDEGFYSTDCATRCDCDPSNTAECDNVFGNCTCNPGWKGDNCTDDINECNVADVCNDTLKTCTNAMGSFDCSCLSGYTVNSDNVCIGN